MSNASGSSSISPRPSRTLASAPRPKGSAHADGQIDKKAIYPQSARTRIERVLARALEILRLAPNAPIVQGLRHTARRWASLSILIFTATATTGFTAEPRVLEIGDSNDPPFTNPERTGFFDVVATEAFRRAGLELRVARVPAERGLLLANDGTTDGELGRIAGREKEYPNLIRVPEKLIDQNYVAISKDASMPASVEAIRDQRVGLIRGWKLFEQAMAGAPAVLAADDADQLFRLLQRDRVDVILYTRLMGHEYIKTHGIHELRVLDPALYTLGSFIYLNKRHAELVPKLASALREMKRDGTYQNAYEELLRRYSAQGLK